VKISEELFGNARNMMVRINTMIKTTNDRSLRSIVLVLSEASNSVKEVAILLNTKAHTHAHTLERERALEIMANKPYTRCLTSRIILTNVVYKYLIHLIRISHIYSF
jgi:hypothetical protein